MERSAGQTRRRRTTRDDDNEYGLFAGMTYEANDEEADRINEPVDGAMDARRKAVSWLVSSFLFDQS